MPVSGVVNARTLGMPRIDSRHNSPPGIVQWPAERIGHGLGRLNRRSAAKAWLRRTRKPLCRSFTLGHLEAPSRPALSLRETTTPGSPGWQSLTGVRDAFQGARGEQAGGTQRSVGHSSTTLLTCN